LVSWLVEDYNDVLDERGREYLDKLLKRSQRMHHLIEGILQYSGIGRKQMNPQLINTRSLVHEVIENLEVPDHIKITVHNTLPMVTYDRTLLQQVFQNLIGNGIKYMGKPCGRINIYAAEDGPFIRFSVRDTGIGIEEKHFQRIFKTFQSLHPDKGSESTGIGLAVVKKIVSRNGGTVWVQSQLNEGSTFFFTIPKVPLNQSTAPDMSYTIMIIDDSKEFLDVAEAMLQLEGHYALLATNTQEAIDLLNEYNKPVHLLLMDVHIPGENTLHRYKTLKEMFPSLKIIACTGKEVSDTISQLKELGVDGILKKPFKIHQLNMWLTKIFSATN
jgi:CheY-like chemotaxis protein